MANAFNDIHLTTSQTDGNFIVCLYVQPLLNCLILDAIGALILQKKW